jgi:cysteinyl-tRNA synthetase
VLLDEVHPVTQDRILIVGTEDHLEPEQTAGGKQIRALAEERCTARTSKNWSEADRLRNELTSLGWIMKDGKDSYTLEPLS